MLHENAICQEKSMKFFIMFMLDIYRNKNLHNRQKFTLSRFFKYIYVYIRQKKLYLMELFKNFL